MGRLHNVVLNRVLTGAIVAGAYRRTARKHGWTGIDDLLAGRLPVWSYRITESDAAGRAGGREFQLSRSCNMRTVPTVSASAGDLSSR